MNEELKTALEELQSNLEGKTSEQIKEEVKALEDKYNALEEKANNVDSVIAEEVKKLKDEFEAELKAVQDHANKLDVKMKERVERKDNNKDELKSLIVENFDSIKEVKKGKPVAIESKAVGNMTLGVNLSGDQPRDYSMNVVTIPSQLVNLADLTQSITISGGTYTFPREGAGEGSIAAQTEGSAKSQRDYDFTMVDVNTNFIAGYAIYSKKMANNLPFLESFLPNALRRDYWKAENSIFNTALAAAATASTEVITGQNKVEMLIAEIAKLEGSDYSPNTIVVTPADFFDILITEKSTGAGYGLPGVVQNMGGSLSINGIPVVKATWLAANKYYVGDFSRVKKVVTEGLSVEFSSEDQDNFIKNNVTARVEAQVALAVEQPAAIIYGDFTAV